MTMIFKNTHKDLAGNVTDMISHEILIDENIHEVMQSFRAFLLGAGYSVECVNDYIEAD